MARAARAVAKRKNSAAQADQELTRSDDVGKAHMSSLVYGLPLAGGLGI